MAPVVSIMGIIGSGKTVQAERIAKELGWKYFSTGQLVRESHNPEAIAAHDKGQLAPTEFIQEIVLEKIKGVDGDTGIILDGSPRMLPEAERYTADLPKLGRKVNLMVLLDLDRDLAVERLRARGRSDDTPAGMAARFKVFDEEIEPVVEYYRNQGIVREIDAAGTVEEVTDRILKVLQDENLT